MSAGSKFYEMSFADLNRENIVKTSSHLGQVDFMLNRNPLFKWLSSGAASDSTTVTIEITFDKAREFDTFILSDINLKEFDIDYFDEGSSMWVNVIMETTNTELFFQQKITPVTAQKIRIVMFKTIIPDQEKTIREFSVTKEIGQMTFRPFIDAATRLNINEKKMISGMSKFVLARRQKVYRFDYRSYTEVNDRALILLLEKRFAAFLLWPSGGDIDQFSFPDNGFALEDIFLVTISADFNHRYTKNYYPAGTNVTHVMTETA